VLWLFPVISSPKRDSNPEQFSGLWPFFLLSPCWNKQLWSWRSSPIVRSVLRATEITLTGTQTQDRFSRLWPTFLSSARWNKHLCSCHLLVETNNFVLVICSSKQTTLFLSSVRRNKHLCSCHLLVETNKFVLIICSSKQTTLLLSCARRNKQLCSWRHSPIVLCFLATETTLTGTRKSSHVFRVLTFLKYLPGFKA
jgi:hypothetical protein